MKRVLLLLLFLILALPIANAGSVSRQIVGLPGDRIVVTRGDLVLDASAPESSSFATEELVADPDNVTVTWRSGGAEVKVSVHRQPGESDDGITIRLARLVNAMRKSFPVDPPAPPAGG